MQQKYEFLVICWLSFDIYIQMCNPNFCPDTEQHHHKSHSYSFPDIPCPLCPSEVTRNLIFLCQCLYLPLLEFHIIESQSMYSLQKASFTLHNEFKSYLLLCISSSFLFIAELYSTVQIFHILDTSYFVFPFISWLTSGCF